MIFDRYALATGTDMYISNDIFNKNKYLERRDNF